MNKLKKYLQQGGMKTDKAVTFPKLSKLEIDRINQANQKRLFEENQAQLNSKTTPTTQAVKNIGQKIDRDKRINSRQDKANLLGMALSPIPVFGEIYNTANTIANGVVDVAQGEYADAATSLIPFKFSKKLNPNQDLITPSYGKKFTKNSVFDSDNFKSEIDWGKWNKEIPENTQLMKEYNTIEKTSKANGSWMKNPDGSAFQGTPEQFVQQNSSNFKNAFGNSKLVNPDGSPTIQYHGSAKKFDTFDESKFQLGDSGYSGQGIYTSPSKTTADSYAISSAKFHKGDIEPTVYELYGQANNPISSSQLIKENKDRDLFNFHRERNWQGELSSYESLKEYDAAISDQLRNVQNIRPWYDAREVVFPTNKQLKSAIGNNGMFDMTNPNIYKGLVPLGVAAGMSQQKQIGGEGNGVIAEAGEFYKDENGNINQINPDTVTHDDYTLIDEQGNYLSKTGYNKGGVAVQGVQNVLSASHENRDKFDNSYTEADEDIKIKPKEGKEFGKKFDFNIKFNGGSPSKLYNSILDSKAKVLKKYNNQNYNEFSPYGINSSKANADVLSSLPQDELIYDEIYDLQESKKQQNYSSIMQQGGKGVLSTYPQMYGSKPVAMVNIKGKLYPATTVNNRTVSMDDVFKKDSVILKNFKAIKK